MSENLNELLSAATIAHENRDYENAIIFYEKALSINPNLPAVYLKIGNICLDVLALNDALLYYEKTLELDPSNAVAYTNIGSVFQKNNQLDEAQEYYEKALELNPNYITAHYNLSYVLLMKKEYTLGFEKYRFRYHHDIRGNQPGGVAYPPTLLTLQDDFSDKILYISHEQGLGDTIEFIRFLPFFTKKAKEVICYVPPSLVKLFKLNYPEVNFIPPNSNISFDFNFPMLESPYLLGTTYETVPYQESYLSVRKKDLETFKELHKLKNKKIKIGINYKGSQGKSAVKHRSLELEPLLKELNKLDDNFEIYSLQYERTKEENLLLQEHNIVNLGEHIRDFYDTALMIESMDIIVSIDTSFLHLAGALGKKTFALLKFDPDWRWGLESKHVNWYKNMYLLRQTSLNDWSNVLKELKEKLELQK